MKVKVALIWGAGQLRSLANPQLEAEVLLRHVLRWDRMRLYTNLEAMVSQTTLRRYQRMVQQRQEHIPSAYITGTKEFCGFNFIVGPDVLIPRPETESLVYRAVELTKQQHYRKVYDVGTGCGNIAISIAKFIPNIRVVASDISEPSLKIAIKNAERHRVASRVKFVQSDLTDHIQSANLVIANLPYVPNFYPVSPGVKHEPRPAIFDSANDGLGLYRQLFKNPLFGRFSGRALIELRPEQFATMKTWLRRKYAGIKLAPIKNIDRQTWGLEADFSSVLVG